MYLFPRDVCARFGAEKVEVLYGDNQYSSERDKL